MSRPAYIARTANDLTHVNRVGLPTFSLFDFRIGIGDKTSKFYFPDDAPPFKGQENGKDDFHFIPEKETAEIRYEIDDRCGLVTGMKLEAFAVFKKDPLFTIDFATLGSDWWSHGKHAIKWDGRLVKPAAEAKGTEKDDGSWAHDFTTIDPDKSLEDFPDGYTTLEFTPYKFRLTLASKDWEDFGNPVYGWTYWQILLKKLELDLGAVETIPAAVVDDDEHKRNKAVYKQVSDDGKVPDDGQTRKIKLISNIFKTASAEMGTNSAYSEYKTMWDQGPKIPIIAKIRLKDSADAEVKMEESDKGCVCLGNAQFLWDWEDAVEDTSQTGGGKAKTFVDQAINYKKAATDESPKGDNCHKDRDGKRGTGALVIFPEQTGYDPKDSLDAGKFPFKIEKAKKRKWAALSKCWTKGKMKGQTGIVFNPSRMAGDDYVLSVYLANEWQAKDDRRLDNKDEKLKANGDAKKKTGKFQIWRELHLSKYVRKKNSISDFISSSLGAIQGIYKNAYVQIEDKAVKSEQTTAGYNGLAQNRVTGAGNVILNHAVDPAADHSSTASAFLTRDRTACRNAYRASLVPLNPGATAVALDNAADQWMTNKGMGSDANYSSTVDGALRMPAKLLADDVNAIGGANDGITIVHFDFPSSSARRWTRAASWDRLSMSPARPATSAALSYLRLPLTHLSTRSGITCFSRTLVRSRTPSTIATTIRRISRASSTYNRPRPTFCGYCMLRLRGWNADPMSATGASNSG